MKTTTKEYTNKIVTTVSMTKDEAGLYQHALTEEVFKGLADIGCMSMEVTPVGDGLFEMKLTLGVKPE